MEGIIMIKLTDLINESFKPRFRDTEKLAKILGRKIDDVAKFLKKYEGLKNKGQDVVVKKSDSNSENSLGMYIESIQKKLPLK